MSTADLRNLTLLRETENAIQVQTKPRSNRAQITAWIPKSMIECRRNFPSTGDVDIEIPEWLADAKGFVY